VVKTFGQLPLFFSFFRSFIACFSVWHLFAAFKCSSTAAVFLKKLPLHFSPHIFPLLFNDSLGFHQVLFHQQLFSVPPLLLGFVL
jgi:hypothetical protein